MSLREYKPGTAFPGVVGRTIEESSPARPERVRAKPGAPNVLFIVLDDTGLTWRTARARPGGPSSTSTASSSERPTSRGPYLW
jgi:hypothetical protein